MNRKQRTMLARIIVTVAVTVALQFLPVSGWPRLALYLAAYLTIGHDILAKAGKGIANGRMFDENFLMAVATIGAFALALYERSGDYLEAIAVMLFYQIGEFFQRYAVGKSRRDIAALMDIRPDYANVEKDGKTVRINPEEVTANSIIIVQPGEKIPIDGVVTEGNSSVDTAALTGESLPRPVSAGTEVLSGSINLEGLLKIRTTKEFGESTVSKILELVEESASRKSKSENFIARFARVYTPAVCYGALALALLPPLFLGLFQGTGFGFAAFEPWIYRALTFLVISCPCALVVSIPLSFFAGIGGASRRGILVKGANILEALSQVKTVVFDKTGTLTKGVFEIKAVHDARDRELPESSRLMETAALAESASSHPIGKSLLRAYGKETDHRRISGIRETGGHGVMADIDGKTVAAGNEKLMAELGMTPCPCREAGTLVHVAEDGVYQGHILMGDTLKPGAQAAITELHCVGVRLTVMLTGDTPAVAQQVARMEELLREAKAREKVAFVGDGINDAPVLSRADVGIAMGALGSDAAIEAANVVLMDDDPRKISQAIGISRKCLRIVRENIVLALGIKGLCLGLGVFGIVNMWLAIFADVGVMVLAVLNAICAMYTRQIR